MNKVRHVYIAHTINTVAGSIIGVYVPAYLLTLGYPLPRVILFYVVSHGVGLLFLLFVLIPLIKKWGLLNTFKLYYPFQIIFLILLSTIKSNGVALEMVAGFNGIANFTYWIPINIFLIKHSDNQEMGSNISKFFALPNLFGIIGPLLGAILIPIFGFVPIFIFTVLGLISSFIPLASIGDESININLNFSKALQRFSRNKTVFLFEFLENIIEESEWFWSIYVFLILRSLTTPGIVGSLEAIGGSLFTLLVGKLTNKHAKKLVPITAFLLLLLYVIRIFITAPISVYSATVTASFLLSFFMVAYYSTIYRTVKNDNEEEFMLIRDIPVVLGRMVVFGTIYLTLPFLRYFFLLPIVVISLLLLLYVWKRKLLAS
jgi:hypothetical protein